MALAPASATVTTGLPTVLTRTGPRWRPRARRGRFNGRGVADSGTTRTNCRCRPTRRKMRVGRTSTATMPTSMAIVRSIPATLGGGSSRRSRRSGSGTRRTASAVARGADWYHRAVSLVSRSALSAVFLLALLYVAALTATAAPPTVQARAYIVVNPATGEILAARNPDKRLAMASTTKMMTALTVVASEHGSGTAIVPAEAAAPGESTAGLVAGERIAVDDLLVGLLIGSGNDAAVALADHVAGSQAGFVAAMNARARALGLTRTRFANPHGLDAAGHYSTVRDLVTLSRAFMAVPQLRAIVAKRRATIPGPGGVGTRTLESENELLDIYPEADGIKTGHTDGAGYALAAHARRASLDTELYAAVIGAPSEEVRARDMRGLLQWGFRQYATTTLIDGARTYARIPVRDRDGVSVPVRAEGTTLRGPIRLGVPVVEAISVPAWVDEDTAEGAPLGTLVVRQGDRILATRPLVAAQFVAGAGLRERITSGVGRLLP